MRCATKKDKEHKAYEHLIKYSFFPFFDKFVQENRDRQVG